LKKKGEEAMLEKRSLPRIHQVKRQRKCLLFAKKRESSLGPMCSNPVSAEYIAYLAWLLFLVAVSSHITLSILVIYVALIAPLFLLMPGEAKCSASVCINGLIYSIKYCKMVFKTFSR